MDSAFALTLLAEGSRLEPAEVALLLISGVAVVVFVLVGYTLFSEGWESYEEKYLEEASRSLDDLFITIPPQQLLFLGVGCAFFLAIIVYLPTQSIIASAVFSIVGFIIPRRVLGIYKARRTKKFTNQLVDALQTLTNSLRSGFALPRAFAMVGQESPKPLSQEFKILCQDLRLGRELDEALRNMYERVPSEDLDLMITSISISTSVGGNLAEVFENISVVIRERHRIEGRIDALTAQGRIQGIVVGLLPVFLFCVIHWMDPKTIEPLYTTVPGYCVLAVVCVMEFLGFFFISKIMDIEI